MVVGLTGGIGSGKTTVLQLFEKLGAKVFIADLEAKKLMNNSPELIIEITNLFGKEAYVNHQLNKKYIASKVFNNAEKLAELNALVHPMVSHHFLKFKEIHNFEVIIYEAAILFESGSDKLCDYIITVTAEVNERIKRVIKRDGVTKQDILNRMQHQLNDDYKVLKANFVIDNTNLNSTKAQVKTIFSLLQELKK
jgi:dephospho-CoA kinase